MEPRSARLNGQASTGPGIAGMYASTGTRLVRLTAVECRSDPLPADGSSRNPPPKLVHEPSAVTTLWRPRIGESRRQRLLCRDGVDWADSGWADVVQHRRRAGHTDGARPIVGVVPDHDRARWFTSTAACTPQRLSRHDPASD